MSDLFTVKLDLSEALKDETDRQFYILLVDKRKTKIIYEFKLWIRFLFSLECPIELVYEDAAIHDLEDIHILSVLNTVTVKPIKSLGGIHVQQRMLLSKLKKYNEWYKDMTPSITAEMLSFKSSSENASEITDIATVSEKTQNQRVDLHKKTHSNEIMKESDSFIHTQPNGINGKGSQSPLPGLLHRNEVTPSKKSTDVKKTEKPVSCAVNSGNMFSNSSSNYNCQASTIFKKGMNSQSPAIEFPGANNEVSKKNSITQDKNHALKPFSVSHVLDVLRSEASLSEEADIPQDQTLSRSSTEVLKYHCDNNKVESCGKKTKKRVRKHKSVKKDYNLDKQLSASFNLGQSLYNKQISEQSPEGVKPKHIRFDEYDAEYEFELGNQLNNDETHLTESLDNKSEIVSVQELKNLIDEKKKSLKSDVYKEVDIMNANTKEPEKFIQDEMCNEDSEVTDNYVKAEGSINCGNKDWTNNCDVLDALGNLRRQNKEPLIFTRFAVHQNS